MSDEARARIGWIGAGAIGLPMLTRLVAAGHDVIAFDDDPVRLQLARDAGATGATSAADAAGRSDAIFLCLPTERAVEDAVFGPDGCVAGSVRGKYVIDTSSIDPYSTLELAGRLAGEANGRWVDAPVSGGVGGAAQGELVALVGGMAEDVARVTPWLAAFAARIVHVGRTGSGQWAKLCNQTIICGTIGLWAEAFALGEVGGITPLSLLAALEGATADSRVRQAFGADLAAGTFTPSANLSKDLATALVHAERQPNDMMLATARSFERLIVRARKS